jgi:hypothetical protein
MLLKTFEFGWPNDLPIPIWEKEQLQEIANKYNHPDPAILVNSTWYTNEAHDEVVEYIKTNSIRNVILASLVDAHIARADMYKELGVKVFEIGYYPGQGFYDFFALCWQRFYKPIEQDILLDPVTVNQPFLCYNRKHHEHRVKLVNELQEHDLVNKGIVTLDSVLKLDRDVENHISHAPEGGSEVANDIMSLGRTDIWCSHFLNVVTETWWDINRAYLAADKYYKPLAGLRPFLIYAEDMGVKWLTDRKFEIYHSDFTDITDLDLTDHKNLVPFLKTLSSQSQSYYQDKFISLNDKLLYNKNRFEEYCNEQKLSVVMGEMNQRFTFDR